MINEALGRQVRALPFVLGTVDVATDKGVASVEGDLVPLMANLRYVKDVIAVPRRMRGGA